MLEEFDQSLAYHSGGASSMDEAIRSEAVTTVSMDSGIECSGRLVRYEKDASTGAVTYLQYQGPVQISYRGEEVSSQGIARHPHGFSCPVGRWAEFPDKDPWRLDAASLRDRGIAVGSEYTLKMVSGVTVKGRIEGIVFQGDQLLYLSWVECLVTYQGKVFFEPQWGVFDMPVGSATVSVRGGPADRRAYGNVENVVASTSPGRTTPYSEEETELFARYAGLRKFREGRSDDFMPGWEVQVEEALVRYPKEWLLLVEYYQIALSHGGKDRPQSRWFAKLENHLGGEANRFTPEINDMIASGMKNV